AADLWPIVALQRRPHRGGDVANSRKAATDPGIAVDVTFGHVPVIDAGVARRIGISQRDARVEFLWPDVNRHPPYAVHAELYGRAAAEVGGAIVLSARGDVDRLGPHVHRDLENLVGGAMPAAPRVERAADGDVQRRRTRDAGSHGRLAAGLQF